MKYPGGIPPRLHMVKVISPARQCTVHWLVVFTGTFVPIARVICLNIFEMMLGECAPRLFR
jgi:hypothetical protein